MMKHLTNFSSLLGYGNDTSLLEEYLICLQIIYHNWIGLSLSQVVLADRNQSWPGLCLAGVFVGYVVDNESEAARACESFDWKHSK